MERLEIRNGPLNIVMEDSVRPSDGYVAYMRLINGRGTAASHLTEGELRSIAEWVNGRLAEEVKVTLRADDVRALTGPPGAKRAAARRRVDAALKSAA